MLINTKDASMNMIDNAGACNIISMAGFTSPSICHAVANNEVLIALPTVELGPWGAPLPMVHWPSSLLS